MRHKTSTLCALFLFGLGLTVVNAQEVVPASGGNATGSGGSVSYTVGQLANQTQTGTNGSVAQGVQQPFEISVVTGFENPNGIDLVCSVYPNPTTDYLTLNIEDGASMQYVASLYDMNGKLIESQKVENSRTRIEMKHLVTSTYFLRIALTRNTSNPREVKVFKIVKN